MDADGEFDKFPGAMIRHPENASGMAVPSTPEEAGRALRGRAGRAVIETRSVGAEPFALVAAEPDCVMTGGPADWPRLERAVQERQRPGADLGVPDGAAIGWVGFDGSFCFGFYDRVFIFHRGSERWVVPPPAAPIPPPPIFPRLDFRPLLEAEQFVAMVRRAQAYIAAGDIYQVCLAHAFTADAAGEPWAFHEALLHHSPAPHAAFLDLAGTQIVSGSPECFLHLSGRNVTTRPIKGTRPRSPDAQRDQRQAYDLITSPKEVAELVMITDLERNDLGRICEYGSVTVPELLTIESYEHVHHLVSTVSGTLRADISHPAALRACFPGGSISGAPKKRALEIIAELEPHPRGIYTGAIGYFGFNGESRFNIAIRTAVFAEDRASFHVGAGIVADSVPEREWQETLDKAAGLLQAAAGR